MTALMYGLLGRDEQNTALGFDSSNYMTSYSSYLLSYLREKDYSCQIDLEGDQYMPRGLVIKHPIRLEDIESINIYCDNSKIISIPFSIIQLTSDITSTRTSTIRVNFKDTFDSFTGMITAVRFPRFKVSYGVTMSPRWQAESPPSITIMLQYRFHCQIGRRELMNRPVFTQPIQYISTIRPGVLPQHAIGLIKGFFVEGDNIDEMDRFRLQFEEHGSTYPIIDYSADMLPIIGRRLSSNILYIPCNNEEDWRSTLPASYNGSINARALVNDGKTFVLHCKQSYKIHVLLTDILVHTRHNLYLKYHRDRSQKYYSTSVPLSTVKDVECAITYESVAESRFCRCATCKNYYLHYALEQYFISKEPMIPVCPICKCEWSDFAIYRCGQ